MNELLSRWRTLRALALARWSALAPRERLALRAASLALLVLLVWTAGVQPAWRTLREAPAERERLDLQAARMRQLATEAGQWRQAPVISPGQAEEALKASTGRLGAGARLALTGDRATVTLQGVDGEALAAWLGEVRSAARARVVEAQLTRNAAGQYQGTVVLGLAGST
jgi:general secretion pathway protein M